VSTIWDIAKYTGQVSNMAAASIPERIERYFAHHKNTAAAPAAPNNRAGSRTVNRLVPKSFMESAENKYTGGGF